MGKNPWEQDDKDGGEDGEEEFNIEDILQPIPEGLTLPDGIDEDAAGYIEIKSLEDMKRLPKEILAALLEETMKAHGKSIQSGLTVMMRLSATVCGALAQCLDEPPGPEREKVIESLKADLDEIGAWMQINGVMSLETFRESMKIGVQLWRKKITPEDANRMRDKLMREQGYGRKDRPRNESLGSHIHKIDTGTTPPPKSREYRKENVNVKENETTTAGGDAVEEMTTMLGDFLTRRDDDMI